jgi:hypothetical protein
MLAVSYIRLYNNTHTSKKADQLDQVSAVWSVTMSDLNSTIEKLETLEQESKLMFAVVNLEDRLSIAAVRLPVDSYFNFDASAKEKVALVIAEHCSLDEVDVAYFRYNQNIGAVEFHYGVDGAETLTGNLTAVVIY